MHFGICVAPRPSDLDYVVEAERLGFTHCWMADSQMIWSDVYAMLALVADRTTTMRIGTGVAVAPIRASPVTAASIATINAIAPGRVFCGIGTGNTAMRIMGHKPMTIDAFDRYLTELRLLLRGEEAVVRWGDVESPVRHLMAPNGFVRFDPAIPVHVSAFGPRSLELASRHGDGLITSAPLEPASIAGLRAALERSGAANGRTVARAQFPISTLTTMCVLDEGEAVDSERCRRDVGAFAIAGLHYIYEQYAQLGRQPPAHVADIWDDYVEYVEEGPVDRRHQRIHLGHNCWVEPDEERFVTASLIERSCLVGTAEQLIERIGALDAAGLDQLVLLPPLDAKERVVADVASKVMPFV
ncbi:MAG: LLM class flavin-dependent oxidoreductase [Ilumatobacter sp.]|nr:LLM class flavin-dependent oxidoreductase [bacterium]MDG1264896.1 LLM class flavin-dependent oxidoreductase [Ilumatobacter sp.]